MVILGIAVYFAVLLILAVPVGRYLHDVFEGGVRWLQPVERLLLRIAGPAADGEQDWRGYFRAMLMISVIGTVLTYLALRWQGQSPDLAFNTANSFVTNTNWQAYSGETLSYFAQIVLMIQQFISPAIGMAFAIAFIRALVAQRQTLGNFYRDLVRALIYVFLPLTVVGAVLLVALGVPETFGPAVLAHTLGGALQLIDRGPVAAFEAIKMIGTNGGGFFNANSAHPFENPSGLSDILEILMMSILPTALVFTFGRYAKSRRQAWVIAGVTLLLYAAGIATVYAAEAAGNPLLHIVGANWVGKEVRFGIGDSALFSTATTAYTTGAVNNFHDSLTPLGGLVPMLFMFLNL
ncbi:MAG TPA: potassium-transporting ATPase subunit KdpA, partial [Bacillota bacterium]|nr:potassium-transporting ATPase subunit KdpA [Bacillota bacterium]